MRSAMRTERTSRLLLAGAAGLLLLGGAARAERSPVFAIVGARILPVSGPPIDNGTLIVRDGLIQAVGSGLTVPPDARVIDAKGLILTPGLIDGYGGVGLPAPGRGPS